ncbi:MAG TPA: bifunctional phosphoribosylaminoimidazolecarboxamide formyltransferase/IMP cyclohydrolase [Turneriella sp.]|nr:bifunctional phosphoribosylaminoimidazolecarboxamide formyltransferase/IMP cyclohydrolase [Turneriella sp.]
MQRRFRRPDIVDLITPLDLQPIKRALLSVSDKTGLEDLARVLSERGVELLSTGGTLKFLREKGFTATAVEDYTGFPEMMDGRVKTLHPKIHGGFLARRDVPEHLAAAVKHQIQLFDLVVVNLYPFESVIAKVETTFEEAIENIDIGGPAMIRSAAKNAASVTVLVSSTQYDALIQNLAAHNGATTRAFREECRLAAYRRTGEYDAAISAYLTARNNGNITESAPSTAPLQNVSLTLHEVQPLRYGENPHQSASYLVAKDADKIWQQRAGKELSFNNILDLDIAIRLAADFTQPVCAIFKHTNPCGVATGENQAQILQYAIDCDPVSFFGGIVVFNRTLTLDAAKKLAPHFLELIIAPAFDAEALTLLAAKKNLRLIEVNFNRADKMHAKDLRAVPGAGGYLLQEQDSALWQKENLKTVSKKEVDAATLADLEFAFRVAKFVKSNTVVFATGGRTLAIGAGQMSRIDAIHIAQKKAGEAKLSLKDAVMASEAFFPFRDSVDTCAQIGVRAIVQPGGSIKDADSIAAADEHGIALVFTGMRHFRH